MELKITQFLSMQLLKYMQREEENANDVLSLIFFAFSLPEKENRYRL
jgi:hypothetical protein